jgi:hypothetical protein
VRACNATGCGAWSAEAAVFVQVPPAEPSAIAIPAWGPNGNYTVTWEPPLLRDTGPTSYRLEERVGQGTWTSAYEGTALTYAFAQRSAGTYAYRVASCNPYGCSAPKDADNTVTVVYPPATPALSVPGPQLTHTYTISWSGVGGAERYELDEQFNAGEWKRVHTAVATTVTLIGRNVTGTYGYRVRACNLAGCSAFTAVRTVQVTLPPTAAPALAIPATSYDGTYTVDWNDIAHATRYELSERRNGGAFAVVHNAAASQAARSDRDQARWEYRVRACNAAGCGPDSAIAGINVFIVPVTPRIAWSEREQHGTGKLAQVSCSVSWTQSANAERYELMVPSTGQVQYNGPSTFLSGWGPSQYCGASHVVRACNVAGCSAWSAPVTQTLVMGTGGAGAYSVIEEDTTEEGASDE